MQYIFQPKRKKYNPSTLTVSSKKERYKASKFTQNKIKEEKDEKKYNFYIRPYVPFWRVQQLNFETINAFDEIPHFNDSKCPRYVLRDLVQTWIAKDPQDKCWFDRADIYDLIKDDLILRIQSKLPTKTLRKLLNFSHLSASVLHDFMSFAVC